MNGIYLLLGSNMGNRLEHLRNTGILLLQQHIQILDESLIYETEPWGNMNQSWFLNMLLQVRTDLSPTKLLNTLLEVEEKLGRIRKDKWGERCIDLDLLYYHNERVSEERLTIPHPGISVRRFTLTPLAEMCPIEIHPVLNKTQMELLMECMDPLHCNPTDYKL